MRKNIIRKYSCFLLAVSLFLSVGGSTYGETTKEKIKKTEQEIQALEEEKQEAESKAENLETQANSLEGDLAELNTDLKKTSDSITETEKQISDKQAQIDAKQIELEEAIAIQQQQYQDMKLRIRFMYENGQEDWLSIIVESHSVAEILNKAEYINSITEYDRKMLDVYEAACEQVKMDKADLEEQKTQMIAMQEQLMGQKTQLDTLVEQTSNSLNAKQGELEETQESIDKYERQIAEMKEREVELEKAAAAEEAKRLATIKKHEEELKTQQSAAGTSGAATSASGSDAAMLAALIECEAGGESYEGMLAVGSVVINRMRSSHYPNSISGVIYQSGQFTPVTSGRFALVLQRGASSSAAQAANEVLGGKITISVLCFRTVASGIQGTVIGNHVFF